MSIHNCAVFLTFLYFLMFHLQFLLNENAEKMAEMWIDIVDIQIYNKYVYYINI